MAVTGQQRKFMMMAATDSYLAQADVSLRDTRQKNKTPPKRGLS